MTEKNKVEIDALLAGARAGYASRLVSKIAELSALVARGEWHQARRAAHKLRGSAATYGFADLGGAVGRIEDLLLAADGSPDDGVRTRIDGLLVGADAGARLAASNAPHTKGDP
jgi:HPt (histidine-containing phosphotransfer) domain-containing protein